MQSPEQLEVYRQHRTGQEKYVYFLLAAAGAAIGFAVTQTNDLALSYSQVPLGLAVLSWAASFFSGCQHLLYVSSSLYANQALLSVQYGQHPGVGNDRNLMEVASEGIRRAIENNSKTANTYFNWQFRLLICGAFFYLSWHIYEMWLRSQFVQG